MKFKDFDKNKNGYKMKCRYLISHKILIKSKDQEGNKKKKKKDLL